MSNIEIEIPVIEISEGWSVDQLKTVQDCDDAHAYLTGAICAIESKIDEAQETGFDNGDGFRRLKAAHRWKKAAMNIVNVKRGSITQAERKQLTEKLIEGCRAERYALAAAEYRLRHPEEYATFCKKMGFHHD